MPIVLVPTQYDKNEITEIDAFDFYKSMDFYLKKNGSEEALKRVFWEMALLFHHYSQKNPDFVDFLNKVNSTKIVFDDSLEMNLNPPTIPEGTILENVAEKNDSKKEEIEW